MATLKPRKDIKLSPESITLEINNICHLELLLNRINYKHEIEKIEIEGEMSSKKEYPEVVKVGDILPGSDLLKISGFEEKYEKRDGFLSKIVNSLMRCSILTPDYRNFMQNISQWDDIILGLDTNIIYSCTVTSSLLNNFLGIPSRDFLDTPDWITLVLSKVAMGEIKNSAK